MDKYYEVTVREGYVEFLGTDSAVSGFSREKADRMASDLKLAITESGFNRILINMTEIRFDGQTMDLYGYGNHMADAGPEKAHYALLVKSQDFSQMKFMENVSYNRGVIVRTFDNKEDAIAWLTK